MWLLGSGVLVGGTDVLLGSGVLVGGRAHCQTSVLAGTGTTIYVDPSLFPAAHRPRAAACPFAV